MTNLKNVTPEFVTQFQKLLAKIQEVSDHNRTTRFSNLPKEQFGFDDGKRYIRIWVTDPGRAGRSCFGFVDKTNGDLLKSASWKAPAKIARGSIFDESTWNSVGPYGFAYLR